MTDLRDPTNLTIPGVPVPPKKKRKPVDAVSAISRTSPRLAALNSESRRTVLEFLRLIPPDKVKATLDYCARILGKLDASERARVIAFLSHEAGVE